MDGNLKQTINFRGDANQGRMCLWTWKGRVSENLLKDRAIKAGSGKWKKGTVSGWRKGAGNMDNECSKKQANSRKVKAPHASTFCCMLHQLANKKQNTFCPPWIMETCLQWKALSDLNVLGFVASINCYYPPLLTFFTSSCWRFRRYAYHSFLSLFSSCSLIANLWSGTYYSTLFDYGHNMLFCLSVLVFAEYQLQKKEGTKGYQKTSISDPSIQAAIIGSQTSGLQVVLNLLPWLW